MDVRINALIDSYRDEFVSILKRWISVPSVKSEPEDGAPFGKEIRRMLDMAMVTAETMGFMTGAYDGYACDVTLGDKEETVGVLAHLDVVPAGDGWTKPPFICTEENGRLYGRGVNDDKGPALAALFAMRALKEAGIPLKRSIRLILGCDEECDWEDMAYYAEHADMPEIGFSPDAAFPVINTEKGLLLTSLSFPKSDSGLNILKLSTGERHNVIAGECKALLAGGEELAARVRDYAAKTGMDYAAETTDEGVWVTATGIPGHAAYPEGRRSAIGMMLVLLKELGAAGGIATLADKVGMEYDGQSLGCACRDDISEALTCNMGILRLENGLWYATLDMRCPATADMEMLQRQIAENLPEIRCRTEAVKPCHHVPAESELVSSLLKAYEEESGFPGKAMSTGGGTYAKVLKQGVAFGACFPDEDDPAHLADESISIDRMMLCIRIYANAMIRLAGE